MIHPIDNWIGQAGGCLKFVVMPTKMLHKAPLPTWNKSERYCHPSTGWGKPVSA